MQHFLNSRLVEAFRLPLLGQVADEVPPPWLISRLQSGDFQINSLGGITIQSDWGFQSCAAGDVVILHPDGSFGFEKPEIFDRDYRPVSAEALAA